MAAEGVTELYDRSTLDNVSFSKSETAKVFSPERSRRGRVGKQGAKRCFGLRHKQPPNQSLVRCLPDVETSER